MSAWVVVLSAKETEVLWVSFDDSSVYFFNCCCSSHVNSSGEGEGVYRTDSPRVIHIMYTFVLTKDIPTGSRGNFLAPKDNWVHWMQVTNEEETFPFAGITAGRLLSYPIKCAEYLWSVNFIVVKSWRPNGSRALEPVTKIKLAVAKYYGPRK